MSNVELQTTFNDNGRSFKAKWQGGAYIDVYFDGYATPQEVINVYDYAAGEIEIPFEQSALRRALKQWVFGLDAESREWAKDNDQPIDDWYAAYIENGRW